MAAQLKTLALTAMAALLLSQANGLPASSAADPNYLAGGKAYARGDFRLAAGHFEAALRANPANSQALYMDAVCYERAGEKERAKALYQYLLAVFPQSNVAAYASKALAGLNRPAASASTASLLPVSAIPANAPAAPPAANPELQAIDADLSKAQTFIQSNRESEAERAFQEAQHRAEKLGPLNPKLADALAQMGDFYSNRGDTTRACQVYRRELQIQEHNLGRNSAQLADRMVVQANAYSNDGDLGRAEDLLRRAMDIYSRAIEHDERSHLNSKTDNQKLVGAMGALSAVLRKGGRGGEAKQMDAQIRAMSQ